MCEENQENGTGIETEINFFRGTFPSPERSVSGLVTFFLLRLRDSVCGSVSMCVWVCRCVQVCAHLWKEKKIKGNCWNDITSQNLSATWSDCSVVLFFLVFGSWWRGVWSPLSLFLLYPPCRMKIVNNFSFSIVLFASVLLFMSHPNYLQLFPIATWLDFFLIIISLEGASLSFLNQSCRFTHLNGTVVFFCLFLSVFFRLSEYTRVKEEVQKDICSRGWTRNRLVRNL